MLYDIHPDIVLCCLATVATSCGSSWKPGESLHKSEVSDIHVLETVSDPPNRTRGERSKPPTFTPMTLRPTSDHFLRLLACTDDKEILSYEKPEEKVDFFLLIVTMRDDTMLLMPEEQEHANAVQDNQVEDSAVEPVIRTLIEDSINPKPRPNTTTPLPW